MKIAVIPPMAHPELMLKGDMILVLAQYVKQNEQYRKFVTDYKGFKVLDNGAAEHSQVSSGDLVQIAREIKANEVVCPDRLYNGVKTIRRVYGFRELCEREKLHIRLMAVVQGENEIEWLNCYSELAAIDGVSTIGISKISVKKCFHTHWGDKISQGRKKCFNLLFDSGDLNLKIQHHLLGASNVQELEYAPYKQSTVVRSCDSCIPILAAMNNIKFNRTTGMREERPVTTNDYFEKKLTKEQYTLALHNIAIMKKFAMSE